MAWKLGYNGQDHPLCFHPIYFSRAMEASSRRRPGQVQKVNPQNPHFNFLLNFFLLIGLNLGAALCLALWQVLPRSLSLTPQTWPGLGWPLLIKRNTAVLAMYDFLNQVPDKFFKHKIAGICNDMERRGSSHIVQRLLRHYSGSHSLCWNLILYLRDFKNDAHG